MPVCLHSTGRFRVRLFTRQPAFVLLRLRQFHSSGPSSTNMWKFSKNRLESFVLVCRHLSIVQGMSGVVDFGLVDDFLQGLRPPDPLIPRQCLVVSQGAGGVGRVQEAEGLPAGSPWISLRVLSIGFLRSLRASSARWSQGRRGTRLGTCCSILLLLPC